MAHAHPQQGPALSVEQRQNEVIRLTLIGYTQRRIANELGVTATTVNRDLMAIREEWRRERVDTWEAMRDREANRLYALMVDMWEAWEKSKSVAIRTTKAKIIKGSRDPETGETSPDKITTEQQERQSFGDTRYADGYYKCVDKICSLYGLDAPKRTEITGADGGPVTLFGVLTQLQARPPRPPEQIEERPANVIDVESIERLIADPNFVPPGRETEHEAAHGENPECDA